MTDGPSVAEESNVGRHGPDLVETQRTLLELSKSEFLRQRRDALVNLSGALRTEDAQAWARVDLGLVFSDDSVVDPKTDRAIHRTVLAENLRNISILLPVLITWIGIASATWAYGELLEQNPAAGQKPFVQIWQEGFEGSASWVPTFSMIGVLDVAAIALVIGLSIWVAITRRYLEIKIPEREATDRNKLRAALADTAVLLAKGSLDSPSHFNDTMNRVAEKMVDTNSQMVGIAKQAQTALENAVEVLERVGGVAASMGSSADAIVVGLGKVEPVLAETRDGLRQVVAGEVELGEKFNAGVAELRDSSKRLRESGEGLLDGTREFAKAASLLRDGLDAGASAAGDINSAVIETKEALTGAAASLNEVKPLVTEMTVHNDRLSEILERSGDSAVRMSDAAERAEDVASKVSAAVGVDVGGLPDQLSQIVLLLEAVIDGMAEEFARAQAGLKPIAHVQPRGLRRLMWWRRRPTSRT